MNPTKKTTRFKLDTDDREVIKKIEILTQAVERVYPNTKQLMWRSFIQGLFIALGATIGLSILLALLTFTVSQLRLIPAINNIIDQTHIDKVLPSPAP
jgi:hypothetical protein